ncbi:DUF4352 domain-containing protein [Ruminococcus albus]|uniref:DUF4352 domain-containing protein n=1 Tax=Ruminococcus albus TaxID=1264 RepID=UPI0004668F22|nr:DUF4352 domain-containing protein [Ruminococcus albus]MBE6867464.1 DUF4352 domain-containing protein [Ruminococcus albus]
MKNQDFNTMPNDTGMMQPNVPMKKCKHCQSDIPAKAKVCPMCNRKQSASLGCIVTIVIACIIIIPVIVGSSGKSNKSTKVVKKGSGTTQNTDDGAETIGTGDTFECKGLSITVESVNNDYKVTKDDLGLYKVGEGNKYIAVSFTFENVDDSDKYVSIYDFDCYADNNSCEQKFLPDDNDFINTNLSSGRKVSFTTYYEVPSNSKDVELEYSANFWTDEKVIIKVQ